MVIVAMNQNADHRNIMSGDGEQLGSLAGYTGSRNMQLAAVRQCEILTAALEAAILGGVPIDHHLRADGDRKLRDAAARQPVRRPRFDDPLFGRAIFTFDGDMQPGVRIDEFGFRQYPRKMNRLLDVEFRGESMMRPRRDCEKRSAYDAGGNLVLHNDRSLLLRGSSSSIAGTAASFITA